MTADSPPPCTPHPGERQRRWFHPAAPPALLTGLAALLGILLSAPEGRAQDHASDRAALVALYNATDGPNWNNNRNWLSSRPLDQWHGVTVRNGRVTRLLLLSNRLSGRIPSELGNLARLERLDLVSNRLTGSIPPELGNLADLQQLRLAQNKLVGPLPPELGNLANLQELHLSSNPLTGSIPPELGDLANLQRLHLVSNQLTGSIPPELGNLANLETLSLIANQLSGPIPPELGNLARLQHWFLTDNQLTGSLPPELGNLRNLELLWFNKNRLAGSLPPELGNLAKLQNLLLSENQLTGSIPPELGKLANLELLWLSKNQLTGTIPSELGDLAKLRQWTLDTNQLDGSVPPELGNLAGLEHLEMADNRLTGPIPPELGNLVNLRVLSLDTNRLTGPIPPALGDLASLDTLHLGDNRLTGPIPQELGKLVNLQEMILDFNQLTGPIPLSLANLKALRRFRFFMNPGLCAGADRVIRNWLRGIGEVLGPDCSPSISLSVAPSSLVEGGGPTRVTVTATRTPVGNRTSVNLLIGGTAALGESQDYTLSGFRGTFIAIVNALTIPANSASGSRVLTFVPLADSLVEGPENIILQAFVGGGVPGFHGAEFGGFAVLDLNDRVSCATRDRTALEAFFHATGGTGWTDRTNWLSARPLSEWHGVTVDNNGCVTHMDLSYNQLTGTLPSRLGDLVHLEGLDLRGNRLTGMIPPSFTNLIALRNFWFHRNSGLCAQADAATRTWLNGIGDFRGPDCSSVFVPVLLNAAGRNNSFFTSELTLTNRGAEEAILHYIYAADAGGGSGTATDRLVPGSQRIISDALGYLRGLGVPIPEKGNRIGTLGVEVSGSSEVSVVTRTTTDVPEGRAGLAYPGISENEGLQEAVYLCGLRQNTQDRSNVALQNMGDPGDGPITLRTTLISGIADDVDSPILEEVTLNPGGFHQYSGLLGRLGAPAHGYVKVEKIDGDAPFYAYAVVNDNFNSDGSFVFPVAESSLVGTTGQTLPVIIETGDFRSELTVTNFSTSEKTVRFSFVADAVETGDETAEFDLTLKAGQQAILPNLVGWMRREAVVGIGASGRAFVGALFAKPTEGDLSGIVIGARTGAPDKRGGQYGLFYNGVPFGSASVESAWIYGLQQNAENRSNLAVANTGEIDDSSTTREITIYDGKGNSQPRTRSIVLGPRRWHQFNGILGRISQGYVQVRKTSGNNPFVAYGVINDGGRRGERSGDGAYLPARE